MVELETWVALGSIGMAIMFIALMFSFYAFLIGPDKKGPTVSTDPAALLIQIVSISGAPSIILAGSTLGIVRKYGSRNAGIILMLCGAIIIVGMAILMNIVPNINNIYREQAGLDLIPIIFIVLGICIILIGMILLRKSKKELKDKLT